jgi:hypothetical protein
MSHHCHARGCKTAVRPELLMCFPHWRQVPVKIQRAVYATYRRGQCDDKQPSEAWHEAAGAAIGYVATLEGHGAVRSEIKALVAAGYREWVIEQMMVRLDATRATVEKTLNEWIKDT